MALRRAARPAVVLLAAACAAWPPPAAAGAAQTWPECGPGVPERCCLAQRARYEVEAAGGCSGGAADDERCRQAEALCEECYGSLNASSRAATSSTAAPSAAAEGVALASLGPESLQMHCALPRAALPCHGAVADIGLGVVVLAGVLLLVLSVGSTVLFDRRLLPPLLARLRLPLAAAAADGGASPPPPPFSPSALNQLPGDAELKDPETGAATPAGASPGLGADALRLAAAAGSGAAQAPAPELGQPAEPAPPEPPAGPPPGRWPERLAAIWATRAAFLYVAEAAVFMRLVYVLFCALVSARHSVAHAAVETLACVVPLVWCAATSRPPKDSRKAWPEDVAYGGPCRRVPRFTAFSVLAVASELYSTFSAAWIVAMAPCDVEPWRVILPYCLGVVVAVARAYSAVLALRLQDEFAHVCTRVLPSTTLEGAVVLAMAASKELSGAPDDFEIEVDVADFLAQQRRGSKPGGAAAARRRCRWWCCRGRWSFTSSGPEGSWMTEPSVSTPDSKSEEASVASEPTKGGQGCGLAACWRRCRKKPRRWIVLFIGLFVVAVSALTSTWVIRALNSSEKPRPPSACVTAQNGTATCQQFEIHGMHLFDHATGTSQMDLADTEQDCCRGCDELQGCQAWMFERAARRCRWIRFVEDPCVKNPGDLRCRCLTHFGTVFGFKPTGRIIWLHRT